MSPEQWASGSLDGRIDQYALGIVFYEMLAGSTPFQGESMEAMYVQHKETPLPAFAGNLQVPAAIQQVIRKATEKSQDSRYASSGEMADALEVALGRTPSGGGRSTPPPRPPQQPRQPADPGAGSGRTGGIPSWLLFGGLGVIVMAVIAIVIAMAAAGGSGASAPVAAVAPTETPAPTQVPAPTFTPYPTPTSVPTITPRPTPTNRPRPTATPNARSYYDKGREYRNAEKWALAIGEYTRAIQLDPDYAWAYLYRGVAYHNQIPRQNQQAINDYTKAIQIGGSDNALAYDNRSIAYQNLGQTANANADQARACSLDSQYCPLPTPTPRPTATPNARSYYDKGGEYYAAENWVMAIGEYTKAIQLDPDDAILYNDRGNAYHGFKKYDLAISDFDHSISLDPEYAHAYFGRGYAHHWLSRGGDTKTSELLDIANNEQAVRDFTKAIELDPGYADAYFIRSSANDWLMEKTGNMEYYRAMVADGKKACNLASWYCD